MFARKQFFRLALNNRPLKYGPRKLIEMSSLIVPVRVDPSLRVTITL